MKIVFFGTPAYVVPVIDTLHKHFRSHSEESPIVAVVTQPPKPLGRKRQLEYSPVDNWAYRKKIPIFFDPKDLIKKGIQAKIGVLASYGKIITQDVINYFPHGILNIHPSILPFWRGSSPVQATIISGSEVGATIIKIDEKLDHGPIISQFKDELLPDDTTKTLRERLFIRSAEVLVTLLPAYIQGKITPREQDHSKASFTCEIKKEDGFIPQEFLDAALQGKTAKSNWQIPFMIVNKKTYNLPPTAYNINNFIRAMNPWPIAWTKVFINCKQKEKKRLKIIKAHLEIKDKNKSSPVPRLSYSSSRLSHLVLDEVQLEGKNPVSWKQFLEGYPEAKFF